MTPDAYRAPMRSRRDDVDHTLAVRRALGLGLCGVGSRLSDRDAARLERFCAVPEGSFVWTRLEGSFHLGRLAGPCRRDDDPAAREADLVHVRACEWLAEPVDPLHVPEQVAYAFSRGGRNFQRIGLPGAAEVTARVWELMT